MRERTRYGRWMECFGIDEVLKVEQVFPDRSKVQEKVDDYMGQY